MKSLGANRLLALGGLLAVLYSLALAAFDAAGGLAPLLSPGGASALLVLLAAAFFSLRLAALFVVPGLIFWGLVAMAARLRAGVQEQRSRQAPS